LGGGGGTGRSCWSNTVVSAGKELLEMAESLEAVLVVEEEGGVLKEVAPLVEKVFAEVVLEALPQRAGVSELTINEEGREDAAECARKLELDGFGMRRRGGSGGCGGWSGGGSPCGAPPCRA
jgi:hypothetical protein